MPDPRVSVVVITRDRRDEVLRTLGHLLALPEQPEVLLVDNASTDGTAEAVAAAHPAVRVLRQERNLGATGRTVGVRAARTPYVAFADDDSWWAPGALGRAADLLDAAPRLGLLAARVLVGPEERLDPSSAVLAASPLPREPDLPGVPVLGFLACAAVVRRDAFLAVGGFPPLLHFLGEETVLAQDLAAAGWGLTYCEDVVAHHHPRASSAGRDGRRRLEARNALLSTWLRRPWPVVLRQTVGLARGARDPALRGALLDAARRLPAAVRQRRPLPPGLERAVRLLEAQPAPKQANPATVSASSPASAVNDA